MTFHHFHVNSMTTNTLFTVVHILSDDLSTKKHTRQVSTNIKQIVHTMHNIIEINSMYHRIHDVTTSNRRFSSTFL